MNQPTTTAGTPVTTNEAPTGEALALIQQTKQYRADLDAVLQRLKADTDSTATGQRPVRNSRERSLTITKLQEAIMWLGMDLKAQNTPNPYPNSHNPASTVIDPTADGLKL